METHAFTLAKHHRLNDYDIINLVSDNLPYVGGRKVAIIAPDHTRPFSLFEHCLLDVAHKKYGYDKIDIVVASGMHRQSTYGELIKKWGNGVRHCVIFQNNPASNRDLLDMLRDEEYFIISYSNPLPHNYVGMSGGLKTLLPGLAHIEDAALFHRVGAEAALRWQTRMASYVDFWIGCSYDGFGYVMDCMFSADKKKFDLWVSYCKHYYRISLPSRLPDAAILVPAIKNTDFILAMNALLVATNERIVKPHGIIAINALMPDGIGVHYLYQKGNGVEDIYYDCVFRDQLDDCDIHFIGCSVPARAIQKFFKNKLVVVHDDETAFLNLVKDRFGDNAVVHYYFAPEIMIGERA